MTKVIVLAYHFPPVGGAAVQRNSRLTRHLPRAGYEPVVVTGRGARSSRWTPQDATLEADLRPGTTVLRIDGEDEIAPSGPWRERGERWIGLTKPWERWWTHSVLSLAPRLAEEDAKLVYAPLVPFESFEAARQLSLLLRKPLVVDLHDPWALDEMMVYPTLVHRRAARRAMGRALRAADGVVLNTPEAFRRTARAFPEVATKPNAVVPNGFDERDFEQAPNPRSDEAFRIVHTGYLHTDAGRQHRRHNWLRQALGGMMSGVDILTRSHVYLLQAVEELVSLEPDLEPVEVHLAGVTTPADREAARESSRVTFHGYVSHDRSVELVRTADLLFLPMQNIAEGKRVGIMPGKTQEYLASGRPILAAVPDGDIRDLLERAGNAYICGPDDVEAMKTAIREEIRRVRRGDELPVPDRTLVAKYEWSHLAGELGALFDRVLERRGGTPPVRVTHLGRSDAVAGAEVPPA